MSFNTLYSEIIKDFSDTSKLFESKKPSAGLTKKEKANIVKRAKKGKDVGVRGKREFETVEKAAKKSGAKNPKAVAAAQMWKQEAKRKGKKEV